MTTPLKLSPLYCHRDCVLCSGSMPQASHREGRRLMLTLLHRNPCFLPTTFPSFKPGAPPSPPSATSSAPVTGKSSQRSSTGAFPVPSESQLPTPPTSHSNVPSPVGPTSPATPANYESDATKIDPSVIPGPHGVFTCHLPSSHHSQLHFQHCSQPSLGGTFRSAYYIFGGGLANDLIPTNSSFSLVPPTDPFTTLTASANVLGVPFRQVMRLMWQRPLPLPRPTASIVRDQYGQPLHLGHPDGNTIIKASCAHISTCTCGGLSWRSVGRSVCTLLISLPLTPHAKAYTATHTKHTSPKTSNTPPTRHPLRPHQICTLSVGRSIVITDTSSHRDRVFPID